MKLVKDLSNSFHPYPKSMIPSKNKKTKTRKTNSEIIIKKGTDEIVTDFCIMPKSTKYSTKRTKKYCERHEVYYGKAYRNKSIKDGLIVFVEEKTHTGTDGVHGKNGDKLNRYLKKVAQRAWMNYYNKTKEDFIARYGKNYL